MCVCIVAHNGTRSCATSGQMRSVDGKARAERDEEWKKVERVEGRGDR